MVNYVDQLADDLKKKYDPALFLGKLCWYAVPDSARPDHQTFCQLLIKHNVKTKLPPPLRSVDIFKRACNQANTKRYVDESDNLYNYLVRNAGSDTETVCRALVRENLDSAGHKLSYVELCLISFDRKSEKITVDWYGGDPTAYEVSLVTNIFEYYTQNTTLMTSLALREFIRKTLEGTMLAIKARPSGGVYFVQEAFAPNLEGLEKVVNEVGASFHSLPLLDDSKQREMLRAAFEDESVGDIDRLMDEIRTVMSDNKNISTEKYAEYKTTADTLRKKIAQYSDLLDTSLELSATRLELMQKQLFSLLKHVKA